MSLVPAQKTSPRGRFQGVVGGSGCFGVVARGVEEGALEAAPLHPDVERGVLASLLLIGLFGGLEVGAVHPREVGEVHETLAPGDGHGGKDRGEEFVRAVRDVDKLGVHLSSLGGVCRCRRFGPVLSRPDTGNCRDVSRPVNVCFKLF